MKQVLVFVLSVIFSFSIYAQNEETILTIGKNKITTDEFTYIFKKNNSLNSDENVLNNYMDLFINFKLKVVEAENLKMDTSANFRNELAGYREQLAKPYLTENEKKKELVKEQYERSLKEAKLDIIFISVVRGADEEVWESVYEKAKKVKERIINGEDFEKVAQEVSDDKSASVNKGHLPFLPVKRMPYGIQNYVMNNTGNGLSDPIKTNYGYYLIRKVDERNTMGSVKVAHIMVRVSEEMNEKEEAAAKKKIDSIYNKILSGEDFNDLVALSDDKGTSKKGGELPWFSTGRMVPTFEEAAFSLKNLNDISKPVKSPIGWHIIKLIDKKGQDSFESQKEELIKKVEEDKDLQIIIREYVLQKLKNFYDFKEINSPERFYTLVDSSIFNAKWRFSGIVQESDNFNKLLFKIDGIKYDENAFGIYLETAQKKSKARPIKDIVDKMYQDFIYESLVEVEKDKLEDTHPEFKYLIQEYHDGILLFDINKIKIWDKASDDTVGLRQFYTNNVEDYNHEIKLNISVFKYSDIKYSEKAEKLLSKQREKYNDKMLVNEIAQNDESRFELLNSGSYSKNENIYGDKIFALIKEKKVTEDQKIVNLAEDNVIVYINDRIKSDGKPFNQIKGIIIADYQDYLDNLWIEQLKSKYQVKINKKALNNIKL